MSNIFQLDRHINFVEAEEGKGNEKEQVELSFDMLLLSQLLFVDNYKIEEMSMQDGRLRLHVRYTGSAQHRETKRILHWGTQKQEENTGVVFFNVASLVPTCAAQVKE